MKDHGLRIMRGWIGALLCTSLAAASHTLADGTTPPPAIVGLMLAISAAICTALASTKISLLRTTLAVVLSQGLYHMVFGLFGHHQGTGLAAGAESRGGHANHVMSLAIDTETGVVAASANSGLMAASHLGAAILTVFALRKGELAVRSLVETITLCLPIRMLFTRSIQLPVSLGPRIFARPHVPAPQDVLLPALRRRGPPRTAAFFPV